MRGGIAAGILLAAFVVTVKVVPKPQPATIYQEEASNLYREGRIDEAIHVYQKALELNPEDSSIYLMPGIVYEDKKPLSLFLLGNMYEAEDRLTEAVTQYQNFPT